MSVADDRGQVVLLAAVVVAVALVSMATAYHGLGYHGDVRATATVGTEDRITTADRQIQRDVDAAAVEPARPWAERNDTIERVRVALTASIADVQRTGATQRTAYAVEENAAVAAAWAEEDCPGGPMRAFGPCLSDGGIVVQERANETVLVGVAVDVTVRTTDSETTAMLRLSAH